MVDYDIKLKHQPGVTNKANHLSQQPDYDQGENNNQNVMALPAHLFANIVNLAMLQEDIHLSQRDHPMVLQQWKDEHNLTETNDGWYKDH